ncbi:ExbD/TolR family protein [Pseudomarimonas arenosa]|uniref:Biopolymer transporter ExbD n=1 Tax=Pseudomarimonas arenosa TaxID=2774145 RepID=A0AAW3ZJU0_9GAMM|nr:biopolymer transporter ExbD [Pseudomarimonas arenosa]MBD8526350.1 biopolymer transporter ExbD [Pseudomarimonas arenosa]
MAFSSGGDSGGPMAEINVTPLVDVMLVLLIIFMVTAPLMSHKVQVTLPQEALKEKPDSQGIPITLAVTESGDLYWNDDPIILSVLESRLAVEAQKQPQPQVNIRADKTTKYRTIANVVKTAKDVGIAKVGFVTTPER